MPMPGGCAHSCRDHCRRFIPAFKAWYAAALAAQRATSQIRTRLMSTANTANGLERSAMGSWVQPNPLPYFVVPL